MAHLVFDDVSVSFGGLQALSEVSFDLRDGEILGLIGPNGAGKTTVFNVITGVYRVSAGRAAYDGKPLAGTPPHRILRMGLARTFQNIRLFQNMTALENVMIAQHGRTRAGVFGAVLRLPSQKAEEARIREKSRWALDFMGLLDLEGEEARNLPYGLQRRLEISRALASEPSTILLDEPAAGLNPTESAALMGDIQRIREHGVNVLMVEHDMKVVMGLCTRIVVLEHGEKIAEGTPAEIRSNQRVIEAYLGTSH
ncbi:ABC transporter ATP-binding protein [Fundidesulfovibrio terrae]|uniref:ABC transporter ATP-binding protein n=1 Tax=Fundidesulfovibrio terrae TaxID=2922866 RepID=UPI001FAF7196|nr:ABC transporter ATP-binding protein [Fundidesulfovibrio terrae]